MIQQTKPKTADSFKQYANSLFHASYIEYSNIETGEVIKEKLPCEYKNIYCYMFDKYLFFTDRQQGFYETQEQIALNCCVSVITVKRAVKLFKNAGVITVKKTKAAAWMNNIYFVKDIALCDGWQLLKSEDLIQYEKQQLQIKQERQQVKDKKEEWKTLHNEFCNSSKQPLQANRSDSKQFLEINNTSALPDVPDAYKQPYKEPVNDFIINDDYLYNNDDDPFHVGFYASSMNSKPESIPTHYYNDAEQPPFENDCRYNPNCPF